MDYSEEIWKPVPRYKGILEASNLGRIKRLSSATDQYNKIMKGSYLRSGYHSINVRINGKVNVEYTHLLIAETFFDPGEYDKIVIHIDGNKRNNHINNLKWTNHLENDNLSFRKKIQQYDLNHNFIQEFTSIRKACLDLHIDRRCMQRHLQGITKYSQIKGFKFKLKE